MTVSRRPSYSSEVPDPTETGEKREAAGSVSTAMSLLAVMYEYLGCTWTLETWKVS